MKNGGKPRRKKLKSDKMYCDNCGSKIDGRKKFCDNCGATIKKSKLTEYLDYVEETDSKQDPIPYQPTPPPLPVRSISTAIILSFIPGFGQIFSDKAKRGVFYIIGFFMLIIAATVIAIFTNDVIRIITFSVIGLYYVWVMIDSVLLVRRYNIFLNKHLREPKDGEKW